MTTGTLPRSASVALLAAALLGLSWPAPASAQPQAGPFGPFQNYVYIGGSGPYGWGPYAFGWSGLSTTGYMPPVPPIYIAPYVQANTQSLQTARPTTAADAMKQQAAAAAWRNQRREALRMQTKVDVETGLPRTIPTRVTPPLSLERRIEMLFTPEGTIRWPAGLTSTPAAARRSVEQAALAALEEYRLQGRANVTDVAFARDQVASFAAPIFSQLAAIDDPLASQTTLDFFRRLDATLIDLADPPAEAPEPAESDAPAETDAPAESPEPAVEAP
ncbi:hypothetical protein [Tautonia marina]|uniref:hypothetical protein n=1 Tax=Tautonia marina TaxID=2653855 RepID=UPI0012608168|nr:hypothetical protein [Tautonia marina]